MKLKEIYRTSTFAWSPTASLPLLATGTVAGALDESFSNESSLEIWAPNFLDRNEYDLGRPGQSGPKGVVRDTARFNRLAWGGVYDNRPRGVIAAGMEDGGLALWDPSKILAGSGASDTLILRNTTHTGAVRGLDFNPIQTTLLASGAVNGEVYIWDLKDPAKPYTPTPGSRSNKLDEITSVAWNQQVQYVLAGASSTGYTVVWDLRGKREVVALAYGGGAGTLAGQNAVGGGMAMGGRRGMSDIAWHPDNATRLVTASEDDSSPVIMVWDLRNARAPEKLMTGHEKGILSMSWCKQDADLLLSCGKDNRALCWNPQTSEIIGELPSAENWAFQVEWCPRNPDLLATAFFDGTIGIHSIQSTNNAAGQVSAETQPRDGADIFDAPGFARASTGSTFSLKQTPKWLRCPTSASFGFGGKLITVSNLPSAQGKNQSSVVHLRKVVTEQGLVERATSLQTAIDSGADSLKALADEKSRKEATSVKAGWQALSSLFKADSRDELVTLLGFSKSEVSVRVAEAVESLKTASAEKAKSPIEDTIVAKPHEPVVSFLEPERQQNDSEEERDEKTPSEVSVSVTSDATSANRHADGESSTTVPSLFGDDAPGTTQLDPASDFFSTIAQGQIPHTNYGIDSSVAATIGSGPSSVSSESLKNNSFRIYPSDESSTDRLITKAIVLGDFESAVSLCLSCDRFADAILLAARGGPELLQRTQKAYFERRNTALPYLRLFQSIVTNDLADVVQNADLQEWQEIFVVLCTFANQEQFQGLAEQLGRRLEFQFTVAMSSEDSRMKESARDFRENATLTYLVAARLERLVNIWIDEMAEEESNLVSDETTSSSRFSAHTHALQSLIEKVTVFRSATKYQDVDLNQPSSSGVETKEYKLGSLYDRYLEYADLLSTQGLLKEALTFLHLIPSHYKGSGGVDFSAERSRLLTASVSSASSSKSASTQAATTSKPSAPTYSGYTNYTATAQPLPAVQQVPATQPVYQSYNPSGPAQTTYAPSNPTVNQAYAPAVPSYTAQSTSYQQSLVQPPHLRQNQPQPTQTVLPPPRATTGTPGGSNGPAPPPKRPETGGWNDAPAILNTSRPASSANVNKPPAITAPFPNQQVTSPSFSPSGAPYTSPGAGHATSFPPPRPGSVQHGQGPTPLPAGHRMPGPPPQGRPASRTAAVPPPPARMLSPQVPHQPPPSGPYPGPPSSGPAIGQTPSLSQAASPGQQHQASSPQPPNPYAPPPGQGGLYSHGSSSPQPPQGQPQAGLYAPPQGTQRPGPPQLAGPPGGPQAGGPPPPGRPTSGPPTNSRTAQRSQAPPPAPKYPPGDRSHIPERALPAYNTLSEHLNRMKQTTPPQQKRLVDDLQRRLEPLFDALNCETLSKPVVDQLLVLTRAMENHDRPAALAIHVDLLTRGSVTDDIGLWMAGVKQLIMRM